MYAEGSLLQVEHSSDLARRREREREREVCETLGRVDSELSKMHEAEVHVFLVSVPCMGKPAMNLPEITFNMRWNEYLQQCRAFEKGSRAQ